MYFEVEGVRPKARPKKSCSKVIKDCQTRQICTEYAMDHTKWRKLIKDVIATKTGSERVFLLVPAHPGRAG